MLSFDNALVVPQSQALIPSKKKLSTLWDEAGVSLGITTVYRLQRIRICTT
jgi:hypothetical protein